MTLKCILNDFNSAYVLQNYRIVEVEDTSEGHLVQITGQAGLTRATMLFEFLLNK